MKKIILPLLGITTLFISVGILSGCKGYTPDYSYEGKDAGTLADPIVPRTDPKFREYYPTLEPYEEEVTITVAAIQYELESGVKSGTTPQNQAFNEIAKKYLNINLQYTLTAASSQYDNKLNLQISANRMPDMFYTTSPSLFASLKETGQLADLSSYFYGLNDNLLDCYLDYMPEVLPEAMEDGKLYALPALTNKYTSAQKLYVRQDWLDICGLEAPTTVEEMIAVGQAFLDHKAEIAAATGVSANRIIPFTMSKELTWAGSYSAEGMFNACGASIGSYFDDGTGTLYASTTSSGAKNALTALNTMYSKGILDVDFTSKTTEQIQANIKAGYVGMVFGEWWLPKDALDDNIKNMSTADWTWVDIPSYDSSSEADPVVPRVSISGYNLVSSSCEHPEAIIKLINLFYDIYYSDDSSSRYVDDNGVPLTLPANGFYYQFVPVKLWDGVASMREFKRVNEVFKGLYESGFYSNVRLTEGLSENVLPSEVLDTDYVVGNVTENKVTYTQILKRSVIAEIEANETWSKYFNTLRTREKILHFLDGYPYYTAYMQGVKNSEMTAKERAGWGIYHEMIDENGSYAYVVALTEGTKKAKYNEFYGETLTSMNDYNEYLTKQTNEVFTQIITGDQPISYFETFVTDIYNRNGGDTIIEQVNSWYKAHKASS